MPWIQQHVFVVLLMFLTTICVSYSSYHEVIRNHTYLKEHSRQIETILSWDKIEFDLNEKLKHEDHVEYIYENNLLGNVRIYNKHIIISVPRYKDGVPSTLNVVPTHRKDTHNMLHLTSNGHFLNSPKLRPFPSLEANQIGNCTSLQNVLAIEIDPFGRLWVVDSGTSSIYSYSNKGKSTSCNAKMQIYQLGPHTHDTPKLLTSYIFPRSIVSEKSVLMHMVLDFYGPSDGRNVFAYISDITLGSIVVFSWEKQSSWKKTATQMYYSGVSFKILDQWAKTRSGVRGLALEAAQQDKEDERRLYFGSLKPELFSVSTIILKNEMLGENVTSYVNMVKNRNGYCDDMTSDSDGNIYFGILDKGCISKIKFTETRASPRSNQGFFVCSPDKLVWINSMFWNEGYLYIVTNR